MIENVHDTQRQPFSQYRTGKDGIHSQGEEEIKEDEDSQEKDGRHQRSNQISMTDFDSSKR